MVMFMPIFMVASMITGDTTFGRMWRNIMLRWEQLMDWAASR